jgi:hypothetical protein
LTRKYEIGKHYEMFWNSTPELQDFSQGPIQDLPNDFSVLKFPPTGNRKDWIYATSALSQPEDSKPIELHMRSKIEDKSIVELFYAIAHFHRNGESLDIGHTINFGRPWTNGSECDYGLVSLPYIDGPELEVFMLRNHAIYFYWILPIYKSEVEYKKNHGLELLEEKFDEIGLAYADPRRAPVV